MPANLTRATQPSAKTGEMEFWLSDVEQLGKDDDEWGFRACPHRQPPARVLDDLTTVAAATCAQDAVAVKLPRMAIYTLLAIISALSPAAKLEPSAKVPFVRSA